MQELLELTKYNYVELKLTVKADLFKFNKKRDRKVSGIKRRDMVLQRSLACERAKAADNKIVKLTKLEEKFADFNFQEISNFVFSIKIAHGKEIQELSSTGKNRTSFLTYILIKP